jgi:hypothetical protein
LPCSPPYLGRAALKKFRDDSDRSEKPVNKTIDVVIGDKGMLYRLHQLRLHGPPSRAVDKPVESGCCTLGADAES